MIRILHSKGRDSAMLICDICDTWIEAASEGVAVFRKANADGDRSEVLHAHKRACHNAADARFGGKLNSNWEELGSHLLYLIQNTGLTPGELQEIDNSNRQHGL